MLDELGLSFEPPADPTAAQWAHAFWLAEEITDGSLDPATGAELIWTEVAEALDYPDALQPTVVVDPEVSNGAVHLCSWAVGHWRAGRCRSCLNGRERCWMRGELIRKSTVPCLWLLFRWLLAFAG